MRTDLKIYFFFFRNKTTCFQKSAFPSEIVRAMTNRGSLKALGENRKRLILIHC